MNESNLRQCKKCGMLVERICVGKFDDRNKKYTDKEGTLWNGSTCPKCHVIKSKENMRKKRGGLL